jgi:hypothetical protein
MSYPQFTLGNYSGARFTGWKRFNLEVGEAAASVAAPPVMCSADGKFLLVPAHRDGLDTLAVDVRCDLPPALVVPVTADVAASFALGSMPTDPVGYFGVPRLTGAPLALLHCEADGAAYAVRLGITSLFLGLTFEADLLWYPDQPFMVYGELRVTNGGPTAVATLSADISLAFGPALVQFLGLAVGAPALRAGETLASGQCRAFPFIAVWPDYLEGVSAQTLQNVNAIVHQQIGADGIENLYPTGSPEFPSEADTIRFVGSNLSGAIVRLYGWPAGPLGVAARSEDSGNQEDEVFVGAEMHEPEAELLRYVVALSQLKRPCHFLEADGSQLNPEAHPGLMIFDGRPWWTGTDMLGQARQPTILETHGWWGPDPEHLLLDTLSVALRSTGKPSLQWGLRNQALLYLFSHTTRAGLSTSQAFAARAIAWECLAVLSYWRNLRDRALAQRCRDRFVERWNVIHKPWLSQTTYPTGVWDVRVDDGRLGSGSRYLAWQICACAGALDIAGEFFQMPELRAKALEGASRMLDWSWRLNPATNRWESCAQGQLAADGSGADGNWNESFNFFGMSWAPAVLLRQGNGPAPARAIWAQLLAADQTNAWLMPGVQA